MRHKRSIGEYLAFLSVKYEVNPEKFLHALRLAEEHKKSRCDKLSIQCRGKTKNKFIFQIKRESEVIAQFPIGEDFLLNRSNQLRNFMETDRVHKCLLKKARTATANSIKDLRTGMKPKHVVTRYGNHASVAKALIADETGTIKLCLWNGQIATVSAGDTVQIENAQVSAFRGESQLSLGKTGTLSNVEIFKPQVTSIDLSAPKL